MMEKKQDLSFSVIIPCYNEKLTIEQTIVQLVETIPADASYEIIVVNDGSVDGTLKILKEVEARYTNVHIAEHEVNLGYGAALKTGIRQAHAELIAITDADMTYPNERIPELVALCKNYDMVVGARTGPNVTYSKLRAVPKYFLQKWISWIAGRNIPDINSGLRVFRKSVTEPFFGILPDSFSFTVTITLAMLTNFRPTLFVPIDYHAREGKSKIKPFRDTLRFAMLILRTGIYFAPLRAFAPIIGFLFTAAMISFGYDVWLGNLTDKTVLLFLFAMNTGMFALLADMLDKRTSR